MEEKSKIESEIKIHCKQGMELLCERTFSSLTYWVTLPCQCAECWMFPRRRCGGKSALDLWESWDNRPRSQDLHRLQSLALFLNQAILITPAYHIRSAHCWPIGSQAEVWRIHRAQDPECGSATTSLHPRTRHGSTRNLQFSIRRRKPETQVRDHGCQKGN
jgi:hypothetical protein